MMLTNQEVHTGLVARLAELLTKDFYEIRRNTKAQHASWQRYHQTAAGRRISRRAWMRHGAMLEQITRRNA
jgi:hypothetical protein